MSTFLDDMIGPQPIRIVDLKLERSKLRIKNLTVLQYGHLPGRTLKQKEISYEHWAFTYIVRGKGSVQFNDEPVQRLEEGCLFWEWPGDRFTFGPDSEDGWDEYYITFEGSRVQEWLDNKIVIPGTVLRVGSDRNFIRKIETIGDLIESGIPDNTDRAALLLESLVFDFSVQDANQRAAHSTSKKPEFVLQILEDIASNLYQPWEEQQVWERNHISRSTLRRVVQQNTGYPLNEYVNRLKISEAKKLLRLTTWQIKEISQRLGYQDPAYFSRLFKKYTGTSAADYREKTKLGE
ncbi:AraC family transcriptional regulator [Paenibacillus sp. J2TS4]|uniref:helix-turn-helix transcriptional regulator n=1 Tax=Paenibacillus sp. J2TS4 TaxID=2807194 RepID=UPI001B2E7D3D|nr:AraC family transcriptional regulator [Paenibacillus sp. J2TS4]GIP35284.1 AraC family transcriptional regulator [Paenibacillus sp. J2TS4]